MATSQNDRLAAEVADRYAVFGEALFGDRRRYPLPEFKAFWKAARPLLWRRCQLDMSDD